MKTRNYMKTLSATAAIVAMVSGSVLTPMEAFATPVDGTLGATSTGSVDISVTKPAQAMISAMTDMTVASWVVGDGALALNTTACVYSTGAIGSVAGDYTILAKGLTDGTGHGHAGTAFFLNDGAVSALASHNIPYTVTWHPNGTGTGGTALTANTTSGQFTGADTTDTACGGTNNVQVNVGIADADLKAATAGTFVDTLTLIITPN